MNRNKAILAGILCASAVAVSIVLFFMREDTEPKVQEPQPNAKETPQVPANKPVVKQNKPLAKVKEKVKKADLYDEASGKIIPFSAITEIANLPQDIQQSVNTLFEKSRVGIYFMERRGDKLVLISDTSAQDENASYLRHDFEIIEISLNNGDINRVKLYPEEITDAETDFDMWQYDHKTKPISPITHTHYSEDKQIEYTEHWNYDQTQPVRYKMTDADNKVMSLLKVTNENDALREEHIFYDKEGNTIMNVSANYEGPELTRFTYYNAQNPEDSVTVINEYNEGVKTKETVYSSDFKVKNIYASNYKDGNRTDITVYDSENNEVEKILAE